MRVHFEATPSPALVVDGEGTPPARVWIEGPRARVDGTVSAEADTWRARIPLIAARWGSVPVPLPSGAYRLGGEDQLGQPIEVTGESAPAVLGSLRAALSGEIVEIAAPIDPAYETAEGQSALARRAVSSPAERENAAFFESFYGRAAACNPRAIDRELARRAPGVTRYWSVVDLSVPVPEGAVAVVEGSPEWWRARTAARVLIVNDWLRHGAPKGADQTVVQTWHGTPLKRLAIDRPGFHPRRILAVIRESRRWGRLLAQNPYTARIFRRAYRFRGPLWVEGYPRNDVLVRGGDTDIRERLGVSADDRVILYAPTWRDDRELIVDHLDPVELARDTGAVVLVRGHSRTLSPGADMHGARVIDVTTYPDVSDLLLVADALITDYSSVMFDFTVTGKPLYLHVPDIDHYRGDLRGFYFDLAERAPGPVTTTYTQLLEALQDSSVADTYADRYQAWQKEFNARDDGHASERVVERILDEGLLTRE